LIDTFCKLLDDWSVADVAQLATLLTRLNETINAARATAPARPKNTWQAAGAARPEGDPS